MKTEAEAKKLWCPHVRESDENIATFNRWNVFEYPEGRTDKPVDTGRLNPGCCCIASRCMMWRKGGERPLDQYRERVELVGFCGLGSKP